MKTENENTNNLTLAQLIEIWEICNNTPMNCQKCPINKKNRAKSDDETFNNTDCIEILHTTTLKALKKLVQLVDLQKEEAVDCLIVKMLLATLWITYIQEHILFWIFVMVGHILKCLEQQQRSLTNCANFMKKWQVMRNELDR